MQQQSPCQIGPLAGQAIQHQLGPFIQRLAVRATTLVLTDLAQTAPVIDLLQGSHDRLYSRLFQS